MCVFNTLKIFVILKNYNEEFGMCPSEMMILIVQKCTLYFHLFSLKKCKLTFYMVLFYLELILSQNSSQIAPLGVIVPASISLIKCTYLHLIYKYVVNCGQKSTSTKILHE